MGAPMEGFFDGANVVFGTQASVAPTAAQGVPVEAPIPSTRPVPIGEGTHTERVSVATPIPAETFTPQEGVIPPSAAQLLQLPHPLLSPPVTPSQLYLRL